MPTVTENQAQFTCSVVGTLSVAGITGLGGFFGGPWGATAGATIGSTLKSTFTDDCVRFLNGMEYDDSYGPSYVPHDSTLGLLGFSSRSWTPDKMSAVSLLDSSSSAQSDWQLSDLTGDLITGSYGFKVTGTKWAEKLGGTGYDDKLYGVGGNDTLSGGKGKDTLSGDAGSDKLYGGSGNDVLKDGTGADVMRGGDGNDTFYFTSDGAKDRAAAFVWTDDKVSGFGKVASFDGEYFGGVSKLNYMIHSVTDADGDTLDIGFLGDKAELGGLSGAQHWVDTHVDFI